MSGSSMLELIERREGLRRLCLRDSTNYTAEARSEHRIDLGRVERAIARRSHDAGATAIHNAFLQSGPSHAE